MLEIIAFVVTFGGMLLYGFGHAFAYANQNRVIRKTVENVVDEKLQSRKGFKPSNTVQASTKETTVSNDGEVLTATIDFDLIKNQIVKDNWNFSKKPVFEPGEDHTEIYKQLKNQHEASKEFESTVLTTDIDSQLDKLFNEVSQNNINAHNVGPNVAALITSNISNLEVNKTNIIVGTIKDGVVDGTLVLSNAEGIVCGEDDLMIIKGVLLPNNTFRVVTTEDADTYENGYSDVFLMPENQAV